MKRIILTGGGTAGHVNPNIALIPDLKKLGYEIHYIGTRQGIESKIVKPEHAIIHYIDTGKIRRYKSIKNFTDIFKTLGSIFSCLKLVKQIKPNVIFSKGSYVSFPVVLAGWFWRVPVISHDSDASFGIANKVAMPFVKKMCYCFPETKENLPEKKRVFTGVPIRESIKNGDKTKGYEICSFSPDKPVILIIGGSIGSRMLNSIVRETLYKLLPQFQICHVCGKNKVDEEYNNVEGYKQFEYIDTGMEDLYSIASVVVTRPGATVLNEILALNKPSLLIPIQVRLTRDEQYMNSVSFKKRGYSEYILEENLNPEELYENIKKVYDNREFYIDNIKNSESNNAVKNIINLIDKEAKIVK